MVYPHQWSPISCRSSAGQRKFASQRPTFYHCATPPTAYSVLCSKAVLHTHARTHTHTCSLALFLGLPTSAGTRRVKLIWILLKQETVSGVGISWAICKSAPSSRQITVPAPHHSVFTHGCPSCRPTNSVKALKVCCPNFLE